MFPATGIAAGVDIVTSIRGIRGGTMVQELKVKCPHCHQVAEIFLSTNACVIILNCPSCCSPIMYFDHKIFILSERQVEAIKNRTSNSPADVMRKKAQPEELPVKKNATCRGTGAPFGVSSEVASFQPHASKIHIGADDITNLKIELALCNDVSEFVDRI